MKKAGEGSERSNSVDWGVLCDFKRKLTLKDWRIYIQEMLTLRSDIIKNFESIHKEGKIA